ncbi:MAG TPA: beta-galactosidase [Tepidisphaeraceae bacterium]|nr:beta-galactosidase [Tepidisphaeraceae bacterium]
MKTLSDRLPAWQQQLDQLRASRQDVSYPLVSYTVLENFIPYAQDDLQHTDNAFAQKRAIREIGELELMANRLDRELADAVAGKIKLPVVPRWDGKARPTIDGTSFMSQGRPFIFIGYGHFAQARNDIEKFPAYGINLIQSAEFGPEGVYPKPGETSDKFIEQTKATLDRAAKAGVAVDLLISPHYFPWWYIEKHPELAKRRYGGVWPFSPYAPAGWDLLKPFVEKVLTPIKDHPALFSICLTNEPCNFEEPGEFSKASWHAWLKEKHKKIETLNSAWGEKYASFDDVPMANPYDAKAVKRPSPLWCDYVRWNQEFFAGWHAKFAEMIHAVAPNVPVHAKATTWLMVSDHSDIDAQYGVDATLFSKFSQIMGCDSLNHFTFGTIDNGLNFAQNFWTESKGYTLLRSVKNAPIFNSENHLIQDRDDRSIPGEHLRAALWQAAMRGQSATTMWVWERTLEANHDFSGSIMERPVCAEAVGRVNCDLNRLAPQVRAFQQLPPKIQILQSTTAAAWADPGYDSALQDTFSALSFLGHRLGFITERQLEEGTLPEASVIVVPHVVHFSHNGLEALKKYTGKILLLGNDCFTLSGYEKPRLHVPDLLPNSEVIPYDVGKSSWRTLFTSLPPQIAKVVDPPTVQLVDLTTQGLWGIEWECAQASGKTILNLCNYRFDPLAVGLVQKGSPVHAVDLLTGQEIDGQITLGPLEVRLLQLR